MTADIFRFPNLGGGEWPAIREDIAAFLKDCGCDEQMIGTLCDRMHDHYVNCGLADPLPVPEIQVANEESAAAIKSIEDHFRRINGQLFAQMVALEVFIYQRGSVPL
jgi:hypothetical protein